MKNITLYIIFIGFTFLFCCKKGENIKPDLAPEKIRVYNDKNVGTVLSVVPADGVAIIVYKSYNDSSYFKLIKNNGDEIWTKNVSNLVNDNQRIVEVLYNNDNTFSVFMGNRLAIINLDGQVTFNDPEFLKSIDGYEKFNIKITPQGNYLVVGNVYVGSGNRSFYAAFSKTGDMLYRKFFIINAQGTNTITDAVILPEGGFMLGGSFTTTNSNIDNIVFLLKIKENGDTLWTKRYDVNPFYSSSTNTNANSPVRGRELMINEDMTYSYLYATQRNELDQRSKIFKFSSEGILLDTNFLDLSKTNYIPYVNPYFGKSIAKNKEKGFTGLSSIDYPKISLSQAFIVPTNYSAPHYTYYYNLSKEGKVENELFLDKTFTNFFTAIDQLSDGNTIIAGTIFSLGKEIKLIVIIR